VLLAQARLMLYEHARLFDRSRRAELAGDPEAQPPGPEVAGATKYTVLNNAIAATELAMRVVGSVALSKSRPIRRRYLDVRVGLSHPPQDDAALAALARRVVE